MSRIRFGSERCRFGCGGGAETGTQHGFSLIELMITVSIFAIIAVIAYPNYQNYMRKAHRTAAKTALLEAASQGRAFLFDQ